MAGKARQAIGTSGNVAVTAQTYADGKWSRREPQINRDRQVPKGEHVRWRARTRVREQDGKYSTVSRYSSRSAADAKRNLNDHLANRKAPSRGVTLRGTMTVADAGNAWLEQVARPEAKLSKSTVSQYRANFARYIACGTLSGLTLLEANNVPSIRAFLESVADAHGAGAAKTARSVLSSIIRYALNDGTLDRNAVRDVPAPQPREAIERAIGRRRQADVGGEVAERDTRRGFTREERDGLVQFAQADQRAVALDVADLIAFMAGTGVRIGGALTLNWRNVELDDATAHVHGTKTEGSDRVVPLAPWLVEILRARLEQGMDSGGIVFSSPRTGGVRDRRNALRVIRSVLDRAGFHWATSHTFRRTVASLIDESGGGVALAANVLGHKDASMTARVYLNRKSDTARAAGML